MNGKNRPVLLGDKIGRVFYKRGIALRKVIETKKDLVAKIEDRTWFIPYPGDEKAEWAAVECFTMAKLSAKAKTILFSAEQGQVFTRVHESYVESLEYKLPFPSVLIQFDSPLTTDYVKRSENDYGRGQLIAIAAMQEEMSKAEFFIKIGKGLVGFGGGPDDPLSPQRIVGDRVVFNQLSFLYQDWGTEYVSWIGGNTQQWLDADNVRLSAMALWKNVAIACIGYINCENVYLHKEGEVSDAINTKRERKGKSKLEPYYVCRIRGVQYDSEGYEKGAGVKHGIRYDVRGHFRRLETGKTIWVRPHQRGLQNELYVPKTYVVAKEPHP